MDSMSASVYTRAPQRSSDCTILAAAHWETGVCTADILDAVSLAARLEWVLASSLGVRVVRRELAGVGAVLAPGVLFLGR